MTEASELRTTPPLPRPAGLCHRWFRWCSMTRRHSHLLVCLLYVLGLLALRVKETCGTTNSLTALLQTRHGKGPNLTPLSVADKHLEDELRRQCPLDVSVLDCYIRVLALLHKPDTKDALEARLGQLCPPDMNHFQCFYTYVNNVLHIRGQDLSEDWNSGPEKRGVPSWRICPESMDTISCFDSYMALWLQLVTSQEGKRTFGPGKRSGSEAAGADNGLGYDNSEIENTKDCSQGPGGREGCLRREIKVLADYFSRGRRQAEVVAATHKRNVSRVCQEKDPIRCFEHYLVQLARYESHKQKVKGFVGKRSPLSA